MVAGQMAVCKDRILVIPVATFAPEPVLGKPSIDKTANRRKISNMTLIKPHP